MYKGDLEDFFIIYWLELIEFLQTEMETSISDWYSLHYTCSRLVWLYSRDYNSRGQKVTMIELQKINPCKKLFKKHELKQSENFSPHKTIIWLPTFSNGSQFHARD